MDPRLEAEAVVILSLQSSRSSSYGGVGFGHRSAAGEDAQPDHRVRQDRAAFHSRFEFACRCCCRFLGCLVPALAACPVCALPRKVSKHYTFSLTPLNVLGGKGSAQLQNDLVSGGSAYLLLRVCDVKSCVKGMEGNRGDRILIGIL